ncbi:Methyltransferase domain-containing protein [Paenibacillus sp. yr247]|uniref:class I SAM-dependent methyltransferase n=1 Tax=Paenibacillus sp. yr247 TaxID=1761880 RepID=UPI0008845EBE|nr:class I SAM-dependent methyltransferase [Paenibacillus sp. yr247]SDN43389.1 Methyltransferase domain-containing protein [Paenibacillus sp. yr247]
MEQNKGILGEQQPHWETNFANRVEMFGEVPSDAAVKAAEIFEKRGIKTILELGGGQGRDTIYFAQKGFKVHVLDYTHSGISAIKEKAQKLGLSNSVEALQHDVKTPLPFDDAFFEGCYSHMLFCMAFTVQEIKFLAQEVNRVLKPDGINVYSVRNLSDPHFGTGIHRGEKMYEVGGFIVHFFDKEMIEELSEGYKILQINEFEEGGMPRRLYLVTQQKE